MLNFVIPMITLIIGIFLGCFIYRFFISKKENTSLIVYENRIQDIVNSFNSGVIQNIVTANTKEFDVLSKQLIERCKEVLSSDLKSSNVELEHKKELINMTIESIDKKLQEVTNTVKEYQNNGQKTFGEVVSSIKITKEFLDKLNNTTSELKQVLSSQKARGRWGEHLAEELLKLTGFQENIHYRKQIQMDGDNLSRPDFIFILPNHREVCMDVKFSFENYLRYMESQDLQRKQELSLLFIKDVKQKIDQVTKYTRSSNDIEFAIMFIPIESMYEFINETDITIIEYALSKKVVMASPTSLFAIISIIHKANDIFMISKNTSEIIRLINEFQKQWNNYSSEFEKMDRYIHNVRDQYDKLNTTRKNQLLRQIDKINDCVKRIDISEENETPAIDVAEESPIAGEIDRQ